MIQRGRRIGSIETVAPLFLCKRNLKFQGKGISDNGGAELNENILAEWGGEIRGPRSPSLVRHHSRTLPHWIGPL